MGLLKTPLYGSHLKLGARIVPFAGYEMPVQYSGVLEETKRVRSHAGLFDVSHMGQFSIIGKNALSEVQKLVTNDLSKLRLGQAQYNMLLNDRGGVIDDLVVYRRSDEETYICVNASNRKKDWEWMRSRVNPSVKLVDESDETALIALQGPHAESILKSLGDANTIESVKYYWAVDTILSGVPCYLSRTGYTGEDGFEIYAPANKATLLWDTLLEAGHKYELLPCGLGARDSLRLEMGYPLHGHELSEDISPLEANLQWVVKLKKETPFPGQQALLKQSQRGCDRVLKAFLIEDRRIARQGYKILSLNKAPVGEITSGTMSPHVNQPIALGFVNRSVANDTQFLVEIREAAVPMKVTPLPFVPSKTKKA